MRARNYLIGAALTSLVCVLGARTALLSPRRVAEVGRTQRRGVVASRVEALDVQPLSAAWLGALIKGAGQGDCEACLALLSAQLQREHGDLCHGSPDELLRAVGLSWAPRGATFHGERQQDGLILAHIADGEGIHRTLELVREEGFVRLRRVSSGR